MSVEFQRAGIEVSFFDAVMVEGTDLDSAAAREGVTLGVFARTLTRGELGCYFSHRRLWQQLLDSDDEAYVIFEDDMSLVPNFREIAEAVLMRDAGFDVVRLGPLRAHERSEVYKDLGNGHAVYWTKRTALGMGCYMVSREAASALLAATTRIAGPVDYDVDRC